MIPEPIQPISQEEAASTLDEIDRIGRQMRRAVAAGCAAPMLILWGSIWIVGFTAEQFFPYADRYWLVLDLVGLAVSCFLGAWSRKSPVKGPGRGRIGLSWLILFGFAILWSLLWYPTGLVYGARWVAYGPLLERKMAVFWVTVCMFAYMIMGLWLDRFLLWLGAAVTVATLIGFALAPHFLFLWIAVSGGGALVTVGAVIRKSWR